MGHRTPHARVRGTHHAHSFCSVLSHSRECSVVDTGCFLFLLTTSWLPSGEPPLLPNGSCASVKMTRVSGLVWLRLGHSEHSTLQAQCGVGDGSRTQTSQWDSEEEVGRRSHSMKPNTSQGHLWHYLGRTLRRMKPKQRKTKQEALMPMLGHLHVAFNFSSVRK